VVVSGGPDLGSGTLAERREILTRKFDQFRSAVVCEPRGSDALVGALLVEPHTPGCTAGAIFFNNVGTLGMCGHASIGLAVTLAHMGKIGVGAFQLDTPVGPVTIDYLGGSRASVANVPSYRLAKEVEVRFPKSGFDFGSPSDDGSGFPKSKPDFGNPATIQGDIAWGGNWFFLTNAPTHIPLTVASITPLTAYANQIRRALADAGITGERGEEIDHIELIGPAHDPANHARNFVLCPGGAYDRSPCGTGTSAKVACLAADGKLKPGETWRQESVLGSVFECRYELDPQGRVLPTIRGDAYVTAEATLLLQASDPFRDGVRG
jgi:4-hydroxyproline epimerase